MFLANTFWLLAFAAQRGRVFQVELPLARFEPNSKFICHPVAGFDYVEILEPHLLIEANLSPQELCTAAEELNARKDIFPHGINVNAWHVMKDGFIYVKTYERGVQKMTRACGSGSACCAAFYRKEKGHVRVQTLGGILEVCLGDNEIALQGRAFYSSNG